MKSCLFIFFKFIYNSGFDTLLLISVGCQRVIKPVSRHFFINLDNGKVVIEKY